MTQWNGDWHPFAQRFPMLAEQDLRDMAESITETGQLHPCIMSSDGLGLDGRNRVAACRIANVEPTWIVSDRNPMSVIIAANVHHRFLSTGQRAMAVALDLVEKGLRQDNGRWKRGAVPDAPEDNGRSSVISWRKAIKHAGTVLDHAPELADPVLAGEMALDAAHKQATDKRDADQIHADKTAQLPADLAALVDNEIRDLDDALTEAHARDTVARIDQIRDADQQPSPSFADRVTSGDLEWNEAATLAEQWETDRRESLTRDRERIGHVVKGGWSALHRVAAEPDHPYSRDLLGEFGDGIRELIDDTIATMQKEVPQWPQW